MIKKAVSLRYPENADAPYISAIGKGQIAQKMLEIAEENNIPVVDNANLTNVLSIQSVGDIISEDVYEAVAKIFAFIALIEEKGTTK